MDNRVVTSIRMKPEIIEKLDCVVDHLNIDTSFWGSNKYTREIGYWRKRVTRADVIEILILKAFEDIQDKKK